MLAASYQIVNDEPNDKGKYSSGRDSGRPVPAAGRVPQRQAAEAQFRQGAAGHVPAAKSRKYERGFPNFVFDIFDAYQEVGADYIYAILKATRSRTIRSGTFIIPATRSRCRSRSPMAR